MFTFLAIGAGISYFILGWSSNVVSFVSDMAMVPSYMAHNL